MAICARLLWNQPFSLQRTQINTGDDQNDLLALGSPTYFLPSFLRFERRNSSSLARRHLRVLLWVLDEGALRAPG